MTDTATDNADLIEISDKAELLALLREVHVPSVSQWPAPGWWFLGILLLGVLIAGLVYREKRRLFAENAWRREAVVELDQLKERLPNATQNDRHAIVREASSLLRRVMIHVRGRPEVAGLTANAWINELSHHSVVPKLDKPLYPLITDVPYQPEPNDLVSQANVSGLLSWLHDTIEIIPSPNRKPKLKRNFKTKLNSGASL